MMNGYMNDAANNIMFKSSRTRHVLWIASDRLSRSQSELSSASINNARNLSMVPSISVLLCILSMMRIILFHCGYRREYAMPKSHATP